MPNIETSKKDLEKLIRKRLSKEELADALLYAKAELEKAEGDLLTIEVKDTNRPDLWSAEGIARELRARLGIEKGLPKYKLGKSGVELIVHKNVLPIRPVIAAAIIKNAKVTEDFLVQMIQLQEKIHMTFGRKRKEAAIGLYDWSKLKPPMHYIAYSPKAKKFIPLEYRVEMDLEEILQEHPKGRDYAHLLEGQKKYPILEDDEGIVASMPPIINSQLTGKVSKETRELLVEVTGFNQEIVNTALDVMVTALAERGFDTYSVKIKYPNKTITTPDFSPKKIAVETEKIRQFAGMELSGKEILELLTRARYNARIKGKKIEVEYPSYRQDILHPVDVIEDVLISYGYNRIEPKQIGAATSGEERTETLQLDLVRDVCVGMGIQEVLTYTMSSKQKQTKMVSLNEKKEEFAEIANPISENYAIFRKKLFPELLDFLSKNKHCLYPQKIFEVGKTVELDKKSETGVKEKNTLCILLCGKGFNFTTAKSAFKALSEHLNWKAKVEESNLEFLSKGRQAKISIGNKKGFVGELSKQVLHNFGLEQDCVLVEVEI